MSVRERLRRAGAARQHVDEFDHILIIGEHSVRLHPSTHRNKCARTVTESRTTAHGVAERTTRVRSLNSGFGVSVVAVTPVLHPRKHPDFSVGVLWAIKLREGVLANDMPTKVQSVVCSPIGECLLPQRGHINTAVGERLTRAKVFANEQRRSG